MKRQKNFFLRTALLLLPIIIAFQSPAFGIQFFSGHSGLGLNFKPSDEKWYVPDLQMQAFFAGQMSFHQDVFLRTNVSLITSDVFSTGIAGRTPATVGINTLSLSYRLKSPSMYHYLSLFYNEEDPIGSDIFLQRFFGIGPIESPLFSSYLGSSGTRIYSMAGLGLSYVLKFQSPQAVAFYFSGEEKNLNLDMRYARVQDLFMMDTALGLNAALRTQDSDGTRVVLLIDKLIMRGGLTMLAGNRYASNVFLQLGFNNLALFPLENISNVAIQNFYFLFEPRLHFEPLAKNFPFNVNFTLFSIPDMANKNLLYVSRPVGINLAVIFENMGVQNLKGGFNFTVGTDYNFAKLPAGANNIDYVVTPFVNLEVLGGSFDAALKFNILKMATPQGYGFSCGYKTKL